LCGDLSAGRELFRGLADKILIAEARRGPGAHVASAGDLSMLTPSSLGSVVVGQARPPGSGTRS